MIGKWQLDLDPAVFLATHWQREPLLIRNSAAGFTAPLDSDDLAGLALEDGVESRLIEQRGHVWELHHGPFEEGDFARSNPWTLLVQAVDHYVAEVADLQRLFDFIPRWRMDDVMVSYATDGGSVGPHYDNYDVFLLQGDGHRLWRIGQQCDSDTALIQHGELRILRDFELAEEYLLGPGDVLYVPPGTAHWGIAQGECTTFSIGFRAPRMSDMLSRRTDEILLHMDSDLFFRDAGRARASRAGEIDAGDMQQALKQLQQAVDLVHTRDWFGELVTEPRYDVEVDEEELAAAFALLRDGAHSITLASAAKVAWTEHATGLTVFANGQSLHCAKSALGSLLILCDGGVLADTNLDKALDDPDTAKLLECLLPNGCIHVQ